MADNPTVWYIQRLPKILESCGNYNEVCGNFYTLSRIEQLVVQLEEPFSIFSCMVSAIRFKKILTISSVGGYQQEQEECIEGNGSYGRFKGRWYCRRDHV